MKTKSKGAIVQCADGTWMIDTKIKVGDKWLHFKRTGYLTKADAKNSFDTEKAKFITSKSLNKCEVMLFEQLLAEYKKMRKIVVNVTTLERDMSDVRVYISPYFEGKLLKDCFTAEYVNEWYHDLVDSPKFSNNKKSKIITRIKDLLKFAYMHKYIDAPTYQDCDVCLYQVKYSKKPAHERVVWTNEEENAFWGALQSNPKDLLMFSVFFACSPRLGEFLALQPNCFDFQNRKITIKQQVVYISGKGVVLTDKLKTNESYRTIIINNALAENLKSYIETMGLKEDDYLFFEGSRDKPLSRTTFRRKLKKYCRIAGIREINPHASRHLQAVKLARVADSAELIEAAARRLGHSPEMFLNTYAKHTNDKNETELLKRLEGIA